MLLPEWPWLPKMAIALGSHSPGICGHEHSALQPPLWPARAGLAAPTVPGGCAAMFELPRCSGAVLCRAVPFQLDPQGSADLGNPLAVPGSLVAQTAEVVARRSVQASGVGVFHLLPSWIFVPASEKFHAPALWAFGA